ncbi:hypothetical protein [Dactylosporangium matsuzakiense]|uniref:Uncharacterized protein n=1 Tax=Dactylosporangium matsuzakiense TaxID=53360 RepID=A0A9W6NNK0_9ACTN|nr:hypothetical protein [Dactylosporangium matsuzakiense]UWZ48052.1 hypothetical protein Dmats_17625 [Dactylosporangium matsuzakiense]GLL03539.1 hypothetical protein GCM10017581_052850 [Dactylosporangium matsuzakiense]
MTDIDRVVVDSLARAADDDVHVERLLAGARADGLRRRRRRFAVIAGSVVAGTAAAGVAVAVAASLVPSAHPQPAAPRVTAGTPANITTPTASTGPAPLDRFPPLPAVNSPVTPNTVGRPSELHISLDAAPFPVQMGQFFAGADGEWVILQGANNGGRQLRIDLGRTANGFDPLPGAKQDVTVAGQPGQFVRDEQFGFGTVRWKLANGLWAQVHGPLDRAALIAFAGGVRFDRTYRCTAPIRLPGARAAGGVADSCSVVFLDNRVLSAAVTVRMGQAFVGFTFDRGPLDPALLVDALAGGVPARITEGPGDGGKKTLQIDRAFGGGNLSVVAEGAYDGAEVRHLAAVADYAAGDPTAWPDDPLA